jgi:hypothetical protein
MWQELCRKAAPLLAKVRGVHPFAPGCKSACEAIRAAGLRAWLTAWTTLLGECPPAAFGVVPWNADLVRRLVYSCLAETELAAEIAPSFRQGEEIEVNAELEIEAVAGLDTSPPPLAASATQQTTEAKALALLLEHPEWTVKQFANEVGCTPRNLYKLPTFKAALEARKSTRNGRRKGFRSGNGTVDGYSSEV